MSKSQKTNVFDVAVVGGGPSGRIAALAIAREGFDTALIAPSGNAADGRTTALWQKSLALLAEIGVWSEIEPNAQPLRKMRMIDGTRRLVRAPETIFDSAELGLDEFGFNILNINLNRVLAEAADKESNLTCFGSVAANAEFGGDLAKITLGNGDQVEARLAVAADGRNSILREAAGITVRRWTYPQVALVVNLDHTLPHHDISTEFHTPTGPFTLVPLPGRQSSLVCVETPDEAERLIGLSKKNLELELERRAHSVLGKFKLASTPQSFPLSGLAADALVSERIALVGETAHVFPPIGAQGLNLSLRDISDLVDRLVTARLHHLDIGDKETLLPYETKRFADIRTRTNAVDLLNRSLLTDFLPVQAARSAGMYLAGKIPPLRRLLMREGMTPGSGFRLKP